MRCRLLGALLLGVVVAMNLRDGSNPNMPALADDLLCPALRAS
jgi:hypothetical protein